jgi:hypothetical protein
MAPTTTAPAPTQATGTPIAAPPSTPTADLFGNPLNSGIFAPVPAQTPDASTILPTPTVSFKAPDAISLPTVDFGQFGTNVGAASGAVSKATQDLINAQEAQKKGIFQQYQDAIASYGSPTDVYNKLSNAYGLPLYQQQMATLRTLLGNLNGDVLSRVQGSNLTDAQRDKLLTVEQTPLNQQLGDIGNYLSGAQSNLTTQLGLYQQGEQQALDPFKTYLSGLDSTFGNQLGAFKSSSDSGITAIQSALDAKEKADALAEQAREANQTAANNRASSGSNIGSYLGAPGSGAASAGAGYSAAQRNGGGFNFTGPGGKAVSAGAYATATGMPIGTLLQQMGASGDKYAAQAYNQIKANQAYYNAHPEVLKSEFGSLFWGT